MVKTLAKFQSFITAAITASATSMTLSSVTSIPTAPFMGILDADTSSEEAVLVTAVNTTTKVCTIVRARRGSTGVAHNADALFYHSEIELTDIAFGTSGQPKVVATTAYGMSHYTRVTDGQTEGLMAYFQGHIAGTTAGHIYGLGAWINVDASAVLSAGKIVVPFEGGVYAGEAQASARIVFAGQHQAILAGAPASIYAWRLNVAQVIGNITALIAAANPESVGYNSGESKGSVSGTIPLADIVGVGVVYVDVSTTSS